MKSSPVYPTNSERGLVFNIQRFSTEDGPGIRTTVFLKGCPLHCPWCQNPEGISPKPELVWYRTRCIGVRECLRICPEKALVLRPDGMKIDRTRCTSCGLCAEACPAAALEVIGKYWTPTSLFSEVERDRVFYEVSGGGVTASGGEPMLQADFVAEFFRLCHEAGIHTALDTCGYAPWEAFEKVLPYTDLVLYDLKMMDFDRHRALLGGSLELILENARLIASSKPMWIRTPIIPGYTDDRSNVEAIARFIGEELPTVERWDLLAFNNLCVSKYRLLDRSFALVSAPLMRRIDMEVLAEVARSSGVKCVVWSGPTRRED